MLWKPLLAVSLFALLPLVLSGSMIMDRAPEARSVVEIFIDTGGLRLEWDPETEPPEAPLAIRADGQRLDPANGYEFAWRPARITIGPPPGAGPRAIGFVVYHRGLAVSDLHYLAAPETLRLNWGDPWASRFDNPALGRIYESSMGLFLHVGRFQVRVEVVGRPVDFELGRINGETLARDVASRLRGRWRLKVNGELVDPLLDSCQFLERRLRGTQAVSAPPPDQVRASTLGAVYLLRRDDFPETVELAWDYFPPTSPRISGAVTEDAMFQPRALTPEENDLKWEMSAAIKRSELRYVPPPPSAPLKLPRAAGALLLAALFFLGAWMALRLRARRGVPRLALLAAFALVVLLAAAGAGNDKVEDREAADLLENLLHNIYRAFDYPDEESIYDTLAHSIAGDVLTETYLDVRRALEVERTGGARILVQEVALDEAETSPEGLGFRAVCRWTVSGSVAHWGHVHTRRNLYEAELTVQPVDGAWKVTRLTMTNQVRI